MMETCIDFEGLMYRLNALPTGSVSPICIEASANSIGSNGILTGA
uniref:Uncharacterized protein n=1 Tax=Anguilla anguilla TaxID=7936 RepID=A0A0E9RYN7_ANGAN